MNDTMIPLNPSLINQQSSDQTTDQRIIKVAPDSSRHIARLELLEQLIEEMVGEKLAQKACKAFRRIETAIYYININDLPMIPISRKQMAHVTKSSLAMIGRDIHAINELFQASGGLRLQHWESGGTKDEMAFSNVFYWPSPGGIIIETVNAQIELFVTKGNNRIRREKEERIIVKQLIEKQLKDGDMQNLLREQRNAKIVREARKDYKKAELTAAAQQNEEQKVVIQFPNAVQPEPEGIFDAAISIAKAKGMSREEAIKLLTDRWS